MSKPAIRMWDPRGPSGNAFAILGAVSAALKRAGQGAKVKEFTDKATSGDYQHLCETVFEYVDVYAEAGLQVVAIGDLESYSEEDEEDDDGEEEIDGD